MEKVLRFIYSADSEWQELSGNVLIPNRSFLFGDGFFETIRIGKNNFCPLLDYHASRISRSAVFLQFDEKWKTLSAATLRMLIEALPRPESSSDLKVKLLFFRNGGGSYVPEHHSSSGLYAECTELSQPFISFISRIGQSETVCIFPNSHGWIKSTSAIGYVLAGMERKQHHLDELLLCSPEGFVVEGSFTSVCWQDGNGIHFPSRSLGGVDSCQRRFLEHYFQSENVPADEVKVTSNMLMENASWICFHSAIGLRFFYANGSQSEIPSVFDGLPVRDFWFPGRDFKDF